MRMDEKTQKCKIMKFFAPDSMTHLNLDEPVGYVAEAKHLTHKLQRDQRVRAVAQRGKTCAH